MQSIEEKTRKSRFLAVVLLTLLLIGAGFSVYLWGELAYTQASLLAEQMQRMMYQQTVQQVNTTTPKVTISARLVPTPPAKNITPDTVTFLTGYLETTNLKDLYYPSALIANFTSTHYTANPNTTVEYSYIPYQQVYLTKGVQLVQIPFGVFPLSVHGGKPGDEIYITVKAQVQVYWEPVYALMTEQTAECVIRLEVVPP